MKPAPLTGPAPGPTSIPRRLERYETDDATGCWNWTGDHGQKGYGRFEHDGRSVAAHRAFYEHFIGAIPEGLTVHHLCENKGCVNPAHLTLLPPDEHARLHRPLPDRCPKCGGAWSFIERGDARCNPCTNQRRRELRRQRKTPVTA